MPKPKRSNRRANTNFETMQNGDSPRLVAVRNTPEKFKEERMLPPILPKNDKQREYLELLKTKNIVIVEGLFGTGKTYCAAALAADALRKKQIDKIIVARPYVQTGKTSGFKPGSSLEKLYPYVRNMLDTIRNRLGDAVFYNSLKDGLRGSIEVQELESIRGRSFDYPSFLLVDEVQQSTPEEMLSLITRISDDCTLVLMGDDSQRDIAGKSGLRWLIEFIERHPMEGVGHVKFNDPEDIVRGGMVKDIALALISDKENGIKNPHAE